MLIVLRIGHRIGHLPCTAATNENLYRGRLRGVGGNWGVIQGEFDRGFRAFRGTWGHLHPGFLVGCAQL